MVRNKMSGLYKGLSVLMAVGFVSGSALHIYASSTSEKLNQAQQEYNQMQQQINQGKEDLEELTGEKDKITGQLNHYNAQLSEAVSALNDTEQAIEQKEREIEQKLKELDTARGIEEKQYADLISHMQFMYESGLTQSYLNLLSEATSFSEFMNISEYVEQISAYDMKMLTKFQETRAFIEAEEAVLEQEHTNLEILKAQQEDSRNQVNSLVNQTQSALNDKKGEIAQKENELTAQEEQLATIGDNIAELQKKLAEELALSQEAANAEWRDISQITFNEGDVTLLANLIYCEARGESYDGKLAVASVVVNRILSSKFPDTMAGVIYQSGQFAPVTSTKNSFVEALAYDKAANSSGCYKAAQEAMSGITNVENCVFFQTLAYLERVERLDVVRFTLGNHGFY